MPVCFEGLQRVVVFLGHKCGFRIRSNPEKCVPKFFFAMGYYFLNGKPTV